ncbi:hypothetical protein DRO58_06415 [Candidatus Bathyarchaeota archaeon]|nr:MAG: hypothetical protein DRO58_06415 [Candidatus Bathyarchaeota archaeon]
MRLLAASYKHSTAELTVNVLRQLVKHVSLTDPEAVLRFIASKQVSNSRKELLTTAYERWLRLQGLKVKLAKPRREKRLPYVPAEEDVDTLIALYPSATMTDTERAVDKRFIEFKSVNFRGFRG